MQMDWDSRFTALYQGNAPKMFAYALRQLRNRSLAEELVEEAFVRLLQQKEGLGDHPSLEGWLWKTLQHLILTEVRLAKYHREVPLEDANTWAAQEEERSELAEALPDGLSKSEREVLLLFYEEECSHQEIARRLGVHTSTVSRTLERARQRLRRCLRYTL